MVKNAVILVAGLGSRLHPVTNNAIPKGGLVLEGKGLVERSLCQLKDAQIERVVLVTGHLREYYEALAQKMSSADFTVETIENPAYATTGSMGSLARVKEVLTDDFLLLEGDLIYDALALDVLQNAPEKMSTLLLSENKNFGDDYFFEIVGQQISRLSTNANDFGAYGELTGLNRFSYDDFLAFCAHSEDESALISYEAIIAKTALSRPIHFTLLNGLLWSEIDDEEHLERVQTQLIPRLKAKGLL